MHIFLMQSCSKATMMAPHHYLSVHEPPPIPEYIKLSLSTSLLPCSLAMPSVDQRKRTSELYLQYANQRKTEDHSTTDPWQKLSALKSSDGALPSVASVDEEQCLHVLLVKADEAIE